MGVHNVTQGFMALYTQGYIRRTTYTMLHGAICTGFYGLYTQGFMGLYTQGYIRLHRASTQVATKIGFTWLYTGTKKYNGLVRLHKFKITPGYT